MREVADVNYELFYRSVFAANRHSIWEIQKRCKRLPYFSKTICWESENWSRRQIHLLRDSIAAICGVLEIKSKHFTDDTPIFQADKDPFVLRFKVEPLVWLPLTKAIPIRQETVWNHLSFTKNLPDDSNRWTFMVFSSPRFWPKNDCKFLEKLLLDQAKTLVDYSFTEEDEKKLKSPKIRISGKKEVSVSIPDNEANTDVSDVGEERESIRVQAKLAEIGEKFGLKICLPRNDRGKVQQFWKPKENALLHELPFSFDEVTLRTIRNIDLLWVRRRTIVRAFEVEGTTSIYSGILRMADLLSLLPNIEINIHLVAPADRRNVMED